MIKICGPFAEISQILEQLGYKAIVEKNFIAVKDTLFSDDPYYRERLPEYRSGCFMLDGEMLARRIAAIRKLERFIGADLGVEEDTVEIEVRETGEPWLRGDEKNE